MLKSKHTHGELDANSDTDAHELALLTHFVTETEYHFLKQFAIDQQHSCNSIKVV